MTSKKPSNWLMNIILPLAGIVVLLRRFGQSRRVVDWFAGFMNSPWRKQREFAGYRPTSSDVINTTYGDIENTHEACSETTISLRRNFRTSK